MRILHICSYYIGNKLYMSLINSLSKHQFHQEVFVPVRTIEHIGKNKIDNHVSSINYIYSNILGKYDRYFYFNKVRKQMKVVEEKILNDPIDLIHAHTLFSDGGTAYKLNKKHGINYIVNVRNTDINYFYKYGIHLRPFMYKILINSEAIVFISHAYKDDMLSKLPQRIFKKIEDKCMVIPNGINDYWHQNNMVQESNRLKENKIRLLFIGAINNNKNLTSVIRACSELNSHGYDVLLNVVGDGPLESYCRRVCKELNMSDSVIFHGYVSEMDVIKNIMKNSDIFIMPSFKETFGLVYIEAMSQGLPLIYTKRQGIDGFFKEGVVGYSVEPENIVEIVESVKLIISDYSRVTKECISKSKEFTWEKITSEYKSIYLKKSIPK
ncbi:glycosyltransferase family 4 protein [Rossellomorea aquimaris]|uniref:glycosyltransferase family 4 protein n=1 Tax=Rossellomorea aquimaris TaxID=189382 RepID=UPI0037C58069